MKLSREERKKIREDIAPLQLGWPLGMPIARIMFAAGQDSIVLLHAFIKKAQKTPVRDLRLARRRLETP